MELKNAGLVHASQRTKVRNQTGSNNSMILVPLFDLKRHPEFAAGGVGTSKSGY